MDHIQHYMIFRKDRGHEIAADLLGLILLMTISILFLSVFVFPFSEVTIIEQKSLRTEHLTVHADVQKPRQPVEVKDGLAAQEKVFFSQLLFGKALREFRKEGKGVAKRYSQH